MAAVDADDWVLVHDAARPCLPKEDFQNLIKETRLDQIGGILALPVTETVKKVEKDEAGTQRVAGTEDRSQMWLAQAPQMVPAGRPAQALQRAEGPATHHASAIEQKGAQPRPVA